MRFKRPTAWQWICAGALMGCFAPIFSAAATTPAPVVEGGEHLPAGYVALLMDFNGVEQKMVLDTQRGQAQMWRQWMQPGLVRNDSLYWWLLAQWHHTLQQNDLAYAAAVQAVVFTRLELAVCGNKGTNVDTLRQLMAQHQHIIASKPSQDIIRSAILHAITRAEQMMANKKITNGMSCYISKFSQAQHSNGRKTIALEETQALTNAKRYAGRMNVQQKELEAIKRDFSYRKVWGNAEADQVWSSVRDSMRSTQP